jgi:hypothetical protein
MLYNISNLLRIENLHFQNTLSSICSMDWREEDAGSRE